MRCLWCAAVSVLVCVSLVPWTAVSARAAQPRPIIPEPMARRHGLSRAWFTQVLVDRARGRLKHMVLDRGTLFAQTDQATVHAIDAQTGETLWSRRIGRPDHPSLTPGLGKDMVAIVNGSRLYVANRHNGDILFELEVNGAPGAGAAVSQKRAYVPMTSGMIMAYRLESLTDPLKELGKVPEGPPTAEEAEAAEERRRENLRLRQEYIPPLACRSLGRAMIQPLVALQTEEEEFISWATDRGHLYIGRIDRRMEDRFELRYRLETDANIAARPTYLPPDPKDPGASGLLFVTSESGFVYAVVDKTGEVAWRFPTAEPILQPPVLIEDRIYVATQLGGMYCLDARLGADLWYAPQIGQFVAASPERVYAVDTLGRLVALYAKTGARLDTLWSVDALPVRLANMETDRIYLATETGLVQCLHESQLVEPQYHNLAVQAAPVEQEGMQPPPPGPAQPAEPQPGPGPQPGDPFAPQPGAGPQPGDPFAPPPGAAPAPAPGLGPGEGGAAPDPLGGAAAPAPGAPAGPPPAASPTDKAKWWVCAYGLTHPTRLC